VVEHSINFKSTTVLARTTGYMDHLLKEATEIQLHSNNFNRDTGFPLRCSQYLIMNIIKQTRMLT
jgi:hypothetical protein